MITYREAPTQRPPIHHVCGRNCENLANTRQSVVTVEDRSDRPSQPESGAQRRSDETCAGGGCRNVDGSR